MGLPGLTELALAVLLGRNFLLLMDLPVRKELALMGLLGRMEVVLTTLKMDLLKETRLQTVTVRGNVKKIF